MAALAGGTVKVLAICTAGTVRSGALVLAAKRRGLDALQAGADYNAPETLAYLAEWADVILLAEPAMAERLPRKLRAKCVDSGLGGDRWHNPLHPDLVAPCDKVIDELLAKVGT